MVISNIPYIRNKHPISVTGFINRQGLFTRKHPEIISSMKMAHRSIRPFMRPGDREPNEHYRPWLEQNVGVQGKDWNWDISSNHNNSLLILFANAEHGTLFELTWP